MRRNTCRHPMCSNDTRDHTDVGSFSARFCSTACELKYEHARADARDAQRAAEGGR